MNKINFIKTIKLFIYLSKFKNKRNRNFIFYFFLVFLLTISINLQFIKINQEPVVAANLPHKIEKIISEPNDDNVAICVLGFCVNTPAILKPIEKSINIIIENQFRSFLKDEIPITGTEHKLYPSISQLFGDQFTPTTLYLNILEPSQVIPPGDYEIPVHFYCTKVYTLNGSGNRYHLAHLEGKMSNVLSTLYQRASLNSVPTQDVQVLSWSIQTGVSYNNLSNSSKTLVNELIPEYRQQLNGSFIDQTLKFWNTLSQATSLPSLDQTLNELGDTGDFVKSLFRARDEIIRTNFNYRSLANSFVIPQDVNLRGGIETTPWSKINDLVYLRFIAPKGALNDGVVQIRILGENQAKGSDKVNFSKNSVESPSVVSTLPSKNKNTLKVTAQTLLTNISESVGIPEKSAQALTATTKPAPDSLDIVEQLRQEPAWKEGLDSCPCTLEDAIKLTEYVYSRNGKILSHNDSLILHNYIEDLKFSAQARGEKFEMPDGISLVREPIFVQSSPIAFSVERDYHPGASYAFRSHSSRVKPFTLASGKIIRPGQQCTYDNKGKLITDGPGAGTPDAYSSEVTVSFQGSQVGRWVTDMSHTVWDVIPFEDMTNNMEEGWEYKDGWKKYHQIWSPNNGNTCSINIAPK